MDADGAASTPYLAAPAIRSRTNRGGIRMIEKRSDFLKGNQRLNSTILRSEAQPLPIEILSIRYVEQATERTNQTYTPYMHQHTYYELHLPLVGTQVYWLRDGEVSVQPNEAVIFAPNALHAIPFSSDDLCKLSIGYVFLDGVENSSLAWVARAFERQSCFKTKSNACYTNLLLQIFQEGSQGLPGWIEMVMNLMIQLVVSIAREIVPCERPEPAEQDSLRKRMQSIERFIKDNISAPITNQMVAQHMFLSIRQLDRAVMAERGVTLKRLIDDTRMSEARRLLTETDMELKEISVALGFSEISSFNRYFRRFEPVSPGVYRKQFRKKRAQEIVPAAIPDDGGRKGD